MRRLALALLLGLAPLPVYAQGSVTLTVCNMGTVDIDVFVSAAGTHIRPATCVAVATAAGATQPAYVGLAFTDSRGQWGAARRFDGVPYMGAGNVLSLATRSQTVQRGNASVSLPLQLLFQPRVPQCVSTGTTVPDELRRIYVGKTVCEDLGYTLNVEAYPDTREIRLASPPVSGVMSTDGSFRISAKTDVNWAEEAAARKLREAPEPVTWSDLLSALSRMAARERLSSGEPLRLPSDVVIRGTVSAVEIRQQPLDLSYRSWRAPAPQPFDATATIPVAEINFRESPLASGRPYPEFNVCTERLDILTEQFGADYRTAMIGKVIEVRGIANLPGTVCWGQLGEIQLFLARQVRQVPSVQFAAGTRVWAPPPRAVPPARPAPTAAETAPSNADYARDVGNVAYGPVELRARTRLTAACGAQHEKAMTANPGNRVAIDNQYAACRGAVITNARAEAQRGVTCAQQIVSADPESMKRDPDGTWQKIYNCAAASAPAPVAAVPAPPAPPPAAPLPTPGSRLAVTPTARAGAVPIASITAQWLGRSVVATGTVARVQAIRGVEHVYFEGAGQKYVLCIREGMAGMQHPSELVGKTLELSVRIDLGCLDRSVTIGATELRQPTQLRIVGTPTDR